MAKVSSMIDARIEGGAACREQNSFERKVNPLEWEQVTTYQSAA
jgi:hypothetical protein